MPDTDITGHVVAPSGSDPEPQTTCTFEFGGATAKTVIVGERVHARLRFDEGVGLLDSTWQVAGCTPIAGYTATNAAAAVTALVPPPPRSLEYIYYFTQPGTATLTVTVNVLVTCPGGVPDEFTRSRSVTYTVLAPTLEDWRAPMNPPDIEPTTEGGRLWQRIRLGALMADQGFSARGAIRATTLEMVGGSVRDVQTVFSARVIDSGSILSGEYVLDGSVPYTQFLAPIEDTVPPQNSRLPWVTPDSPSQLVEPQRTNVRIAEVFRLYIQYQAPSDDAIWVTLGRWDWGWAVTARRDAGNWSLITSAFTYQDLPNHTLLGACVASDLPEWRDTIQAVTARRGPLAGAVLPTDQASAPVVVLATSAGLQPDPTTGAWSPDETAPSTNPGDMKRQSGRQLVMFDPPPFDMRDPLRPETDFFRRVRVGASLGINLGPDYVVSPGRSFYLAWTRLATVQAAGYGSALVLPSDLRCEGLDIRPLPERAGKPQALRFSVAPFCWDGDQAYWAQFAHVPFDGPEDFSMLGYQVAVRGLAAQHGHAIHARQLDAGTLEVVFNGMPYHGLLAQIAALPQTARVLNWWGDLPDPYPDDM